MVYALSQVGRPYRNRADGPNAFDCSGLTLASYRHIGVPLPHQAAAQAKQGEAVDWVSQPLVPGDLVFTRGGSPRRDVGHVGIAVSPLEWVVAPRTGQDVQREPIPFDRIQVVRRIIGG